MKWIKLLALSLTLNLTASLSVIDNGYVKPQVIDLLNITEVDYQPNVSSIVNATQQFWLRDSNKERWELDQKYFSKLPQMKGLLEELKLIKTINPQKKQYDYALILGATVKSVRKRFGFLIKQWEKGVRFNSLVLLGGQRPLNQYETAQAFLTSDDPLVKLRPDWVWAQVMPKTEIEMMQLVYEQIQMPDDMRALPVTIIDSQGSIDEQGVWKRPSTIDTVIDWMKTNPAKGTCLFVSNQPFVGYQHAAIGRYCDFDYETVGIKTSWENLEKTYGDSTASLLLDSLARWLYQESQD